ncbi:MAG: M48 family metallopeptidase [Alphaproteobacteria bacterium]|nr:M48 family metallopeptidase [Alphaproteobacteria bacterium]
MEFENKEAPENINVSNVNPIVNFAKLMAGAAIIVASFIVVVIFVVKLFLPMVPFEYERKLADLIFMPENRENSKDISPEHKAIKNELQSLADRLVYVMDMPEDVSVTVIYQDTDTVNAFASIGGYVFIHRGLLEKMKSENMLAMVMAHELTHVKNRDPFTAMSSSIIISLTMSAISGGSDTDASMIVKIPSTLAYLSYSRDMEKKADLGALDAVNALYGHVNGAPQMFDVLESLEKGEGDKVDSDEELEGKKKGTSHYLSFLMTHPTTERREKAMKELAKERYWQIDGTLEPLPDVLLMKNGKRNKKFLIK